MKKYHVLFDWPIAEITRLTDSDEADAYALRLDAASQDTFVSLTEEIRGLGADLAQAKAARTHFSDWSRLEHNINKFATEFSDFPNAAFRKLKVFVVLASMLSTTRVVLDTEDVDEMLFEVKHLGTTLPLQWFVYENSMMFQNSLVVICCNDFGRLANEFQADSARISPKIVFHTLAALAQAQELPACHVAIIKRMPEPISDETVEAFVHLHFLARGKEIYTPHQYKQLPKAGNLDAINPEYPYHQWNDVFGVLSEYNSRSELLLKFLTIYHVIENFMFKRPIVELESKQGGRMFSIRDFRRLYDQVDMAESKALNKLFSTIFQVQASGSTTLEQRVITLWGALPSVISITEIDTALMEIGINKQYSQFVAGNQAPASFTDLVYKLRCAIVHNKETEFHLTYASLTTGFTALIESFLLPALEEICFTLIGSPNPYVWYSNRDLKFY